MNLLPDTATGLEVLWTCGAVQGSLMASGMLAFWRDRERLRKRRGENGNLSAAIKTHIRRKFYYLGCHIGFFTIGTLALSLPPREPISGAAALAGPLTALVLIGVMVGMQVDMVRTFLTYREIERTPGHGERTQHRGER